MNANETEYSVEDDFITGKFNVEKGSRKNFLKVKAHESMLLIGEIAVDNSKSFDGVKILSTPYGYVPLEVKTAERWTIWANGIDISTGQSSIQKAENLCSPCVTSWCQTGTCERKGEKEMWCLVISL